MAKRIKHWKDHEILRISEIREILETENLEFNIDLVKSIVEFKDNTGFIFTIPLFIYGDHLYCEKIRLIRWLSYITPGMVVSQYVAIRGTKEYDEYDGVVIIHPLLRFEVIVKKNGEEIHRKTFNEYDKAFTFMAVNTKMKKPDYTDRSIDY